MKYRLYLILGIFTLILMSFEICYSQQIPDGKYFGQTPPGLTPEVFAPDIISLNNRYEYILVFSPDLRECVWGVTNSSWSFFTLMFTKMADDSSWIEPIDAPFQGNGDGLLPAYTQDGNKVFLVSSRPAWPPFNIWYSERNDSIWNEPIELPSPVNTNSDEFGLSLTENDKLYFTSNRSGGFGQHDIYSSMPVDTQYTLVENIGPPINTQYNEASPFISPDESYLIFESNRPGGYGQVDLYISFFKDSTWGEPYNLGPEINTSQIEDGAFVSPDDKYLFFNRRESWVTNEQTDIYWVDATVIFDTSSTGIEEVGTIPLEFHLDQNYPNPFNPTTTINYQLKNETDVNLTVFDIFGRNIKTLVNKRQNTGLYSVSFDASDLASGIYIYKIKASKFEQSRKMILLR